MGTSSFDGFDRHPSWSPDGTQVAYSTVRWGDSPGSDNMVWLSLIRADGGGVTPLTPPVQLAVYDDDDPAWSPDGRQIAYTRSGDVWLMDSDGSDQQPITAGSQPDWQTLPPPQSPAPAAPLPPTPLAPTPLVPTPPGRVARDVRCERFPKVIRGTTLKMVKARTASQKATTRTAKRVALKRLRTHAAQRERYRAVYRMVCR